MKGSTIADIRADLFTVTFSVVLVCFVAGLAPLTATQITNDSRSKHWRLNYSRNSGFAGITETVMLNDDGVTRVWSRSNGTLCFSASEAHLSETKKLISELDLSGAPKPAQTKQQQLPDMPGYSFALKYGNYTYDLNRGEQPQATTKRLFDLISQLNAEGSRRLAAMKKTASAPTGSVPCPASAQ